MAAWTTAAMFSASRSRTLKRVGRQPYRISKEATTDKRPALSHIMAGYVFGLFLFSDPLEGPGWCAHELAGEL